MKTVPSVFARIAAVADDIISQNLRRDHVEDRDRLLRGLTLHRSGREPDGRIAQEL